MPTRAIGQVLHRARRRAAHRRRHLRRAPLGQHDPGAARALGHARHRPEVLRVLHLVEREHQRVVGVEQGIGVRVRIRADLGAQPLVVGRAAALARAPARRSRLHAARAIPRAPPARSRTRAGRAACRGAPRAPRCGRRRSRRRARAGRLGRVADSQPRPRAGRGSGRPAEVARRRAPPRAPRRAAGAPRAPRPRPPAASRARARRASREVGPAPPARPRRSAGWPPRPNRTGRPVPAAVLKSSARASKNARERLESGRAPRRSSRRTASRTRSHRARPRPRAPPRSSHRLAVVGADHPHDERVAAELRRARRAAGGCCPTDFAIFSLAHLHHAVVHPGPASGLPRAASVWAISFSWCGKTRSEPPPWTSNGMPSTSSAIAEHSMCQPGRPSPQGDSHAGVLALLARLPEREVLRRLLQLGGVVALALLHLLQRAVRELAVARRTTRRGSTRRRRARRRARLDQVLDQPDDRADRLGRLRLGVGAPEAEPVGVLHVARRSSRAPARRSAPRARGRRRRSCRSRR